MEAVAQVLGVLCGAVIGTVLGIKIANWMRL